MPEAMSRGTVSSQSFVLTLAIPPSCKDSPKKRPTVFL